MSVKKRILILDDEVLIAESLLFLLENAGYEARFTTTVDEGISALEDFRPNLVITDMKLPRGSGLDMLSAAKQMSPVPSVICISGMELSEEEVIGFDGVFKKPFDKQNFLDFIRDLLAK